MARKRLDPIPPGEILREEFMRPLGVSINTLARDLDVPPNRISEIVNGKRAITADTALRLGKYFGVSPETPQPDAYQDGESFGLSVFLRDGDSLFRTYFTSQRGVETLGSVWTLLDLTPLGRQENWEDSPAGYPQTKPYEWWRRHDEYEDV